MASQAAAAAAAAAARQAASSMDVDPQQTGNRVCCNRCSTRSTWANRWLNSSSSSSSSSRAAATWRSPASCAVCRRAGPGCRAAGRPGCDRRRRKPVPRSKACSSSRRAVGTSRWAAGRWAGRTATSRRTCSKEWVARCPPASAARRARARGAMRGRTAAAAAATAAAAAGAAPAARPRLAGAAAEGLMMSPKKNGGLQRLFAQAALEGLRRRATPRSPRSHAHDLATRRRRCHRSRAGRDALEMADLCKREPLQRRRGSSTRWRRGSSRRRRR